MNALHLFTLANIPVRVSLGYLLLGGYFAYSALPAGPAFALVAIFTLTLSLLVHELGHALVAKRFRLNPEVTLHGWGGLCRHEQARSNRDAALIIAAGPGAGLVFGGLIWGVTELLVATSPELFEGRLLFWFTLQTLIYINIYWSLLNLLPLWPLDGGQLFRLLMLRLAPPAKADKITHLVGAGVAAVGAILALTIFNRVFVGIIAVLLLFDNLRRINRLAAGGPVRARNTQADQLLFEATGALAANNPREALRLAYQAKDSGGVSGAQLDAIWVVLAVASEACGELEDAVDYSMRAPRIAPVFIARLRALAGLGRAEQARRELAEPDAPALSEADRAELERLLA